ncbi:MAG: tyrosine-type recombinase/integrase, partial [Thiomonas sp.]
WAVPHDCIIAAILGYRCGLRRSEIRGLRWIDVQWQPQPLLFVRSHAGRALKRDSGRRVLVLTAFCPPDELAQLHRAHGAIQKLIAADVADRETVLLLPDHTAPDQPLLESVVFDPVTAAMREVCAEDGLRFHHLRHSAANHLLLQLMHDQLDGAAHLLDPQGALGAGFIAARRRALLGEGPAQRPLLWAVAAFMGHATPQTTLGSYIHLLDALLGLAVRQACARPPAEIVGWLVGATANHVNVQHHHWGVETPWSELGAGWARKMAQRVQPPLPTPQRRPGAGQPGGAAPGSGMTPSVDTLLNITEALDLLSELSKSPTSAAARRHVSAAQARRIHGWMQAWSQLRGKSPALKKSPARRNQPIRVGQLLLDRPRAFQRIQSKPLRALAQAWLDGWRSWWQQDAAAVEQALTLHWALHDSDVHAMVFTDVNDAVRWTQVIDALCLRAPHLPQVQWAWQFEPSARSPLPEAAQRQQWASTLGLGVDAIACLPSRTFHPSRPAPPLGRLRVQDVSLGKAHPGGSLTALDVAAYVMTLSILMRTKLPSP